MLAIFLSNNDEGYLENTTIEKHLLQEHISKIENSQISLNFDMLLPIATMFNIQISVWYPLIDDPDVTRSSNTEFILVKPDRRLFETQCDTIKCTTDDNMVTVSYVNKQFGMVATVPNEQKDWQYKLRKDSFSYLNRDMDVRRRKERDQQHLTNFVDSYHRDEDVPAPSETDNSSLAATAATFFDKNTLTPTNSLIQETASRVTPELMGKIFGTDSPMDTKDNIDSMSTTQVMEEIQNLPDCFTQPTSGNESTTANTTNEVTNTLVILKGTKAVKRNGKSGKKN